MSKFNKHLRRHAVIGLVAMVAMAGAASVYSSGTAIAQMAGHHGGGGHMHGADGTGHDEVNMPGLRGANATPEESAELAVMFRNFETLSREVTNLPNGIRTVTHSSNPEVMENLVSHVTGMIGRVETGDDPQIVIQSPTLDIFFARGDGIETEIDVTDDGIVVVQTSDDPELVESLQVHAAEVSAMAERGMQAVHEMMMQRAGN
jgi:hypothetical protein